MGETSNAWPQVRVELPSAGATRLLITGRADRIEHTLRRVATVLLLGDEDDDLFQIGFGGGRPIRNRHLFWNPKLVEPLRNAGPECVDIKRLRFAAIALFFCELEFFANPCQLTLIRPKLLDALFQRQPGQLVLGTSGDELLKRGPIAGG